MAPSGDDLARAASVEDWEDGEIRSYTITAEYHGERLDKVLSVLIGGASRALIQQFIDAGQVQYKGVICTKSSTKVLAGQEVQITLVHSAASKAFAPEDIALDVVYEDDHLLVVNKPAGLVVHPAPGNWTGTLLNAVLFHSPQNVHLPRAGIVHRLDKDTSGLMVVAKTRVAMDSLVLAISERRVSRQYLALTQSQWIYPSPHTVEQAIGRDKDNRLRMAVVNLMYEAGKQARTDFYLLDASAKGSLLQCVLHTGRTHQIRVHLAHLGCPIAGDVVYGGRAQAQPIARQALHAFRLALAHPVSAQALVWQAPLPADMNGLLEQWSLGYNAGSPEVPLSGH